MARVGVAEEHLRHNNTANDFAQAGLYEYLEKRMRESDANFGIKPCPRCKRPVEKNGACSHMQCGAAAHGNASQAIARGLGCGAHFCWTCGWVPAATTQQCRSVREGGGGDIGLRCCCTAGRIQLKALSSPRLQMVRR